MMNASTSLTSEDIYSYVVEKTPRQNASSMLKLHQEEAHQGSERRQNATYLKKVISCRN